MKAWFLRRMMNLFRRLSRTSLWFETRFSDLGRMLLGGAIVTTVFGIDTFQTNAYQFSAILTALLIVPWVMSLRWRPNLSVRRELPDTVTHNVETTYDVVVTNLGAQAEHDLKLVDRLQTRYPDAQMFEQTRPGRREAGLNWFDRRVGFPRWLYLLRRSRGARLDTIEIPTIPAGGSVRVKVPMLPLRRGKIAFTGLIIKRPDPLGIFFAEHRIAQAGELVSLPRRHPVPQLHWSSRRHFHRGGLTLAATVGDTEEFIGLRDYRPGDALRHIHWKSFAKRGEPVVKEHQDEFFDRHALVIDTYSKSTQHEEFETAVEVAASLLQGDRPSDSILDLVFVEQRIWQLTTGRSLSSNQHVLAQIAEIQANDTDDFEHVVEYLKRFTDRLASIILICTTWDDDRERFVEELASSQVTCLVLLIGNGADEVQSPGPQVARHICTLDPTRLDQDLLTLSAVSAQFATVR